MTLLFEPVLNYTVGIVLLRLGTRTLERDLKEELTVLKVPSKMLGKSLMR